MWPPSHHSRPTSGAAAADGGSVKVAISTFRTLPFDLQGIPPFNQDDEQHPPVHVTDLKIRIRAADAILLVAPEYNYSIPGVLKNGMSAHCVHGFGRVMALGRMALS
jgi:putative NADPH-quinone reductase